MEKGFRVVGVRVHWKEEPLKLLLRKIDGDPRWNLFQEANEMEMKMRNIKKMSDVKETTYTQNMSNGALFGDFKNFK